MPGMLNRMACGVASALAIKGLRLAAGHPPKGDYVGPTFASLGPTAPCWPYVSRMLPQVGPMLTLCWPYVRLC